MSLSRLHRHIAKWGIPISLHKRTPSWLRNFLRNVSSLPSTAHLCRRHQLYLATTLPQHLLSIISHQTLRTNPHHMFTDTNCVVNFITVFGKKGKNPAILWVSFSIFNVSLSCGLDIIITMLLCSFVCTSVLIFLSVVDHELLNFVGCVKHTAFRWYFISRYTLAMLWFLVCTFYALLFTVKLMLYKQPDLLSDENIANSRKLCSQLRACMCTVRDDVVAINIWLGESPSHDDPVIARNRDLNRDLRRSSYTRCGFRRWSLIHATRTALECPCRPEREISSETYLYGDSSERWYAYINTCVCLYDLASRINKL